MKTILVLTDFSENAQKATDTAVVLADKLKADLLLFNAYTVPVLIPSTMPIPWSEEYYNIPKQDSAENLKKELIRIQKIFTAKNYAAETTNVHTLSLEGPLVESVQAIVKEKDIVMIVMGARNNTSSDFIFGSDINAILNKVNRPVLLIPGKQVNPELKQIVFATDLASQDIEALKWLITFAKNFSSGIHVCHVSAPAGLAANFREEDKISEFVHDISGLTFGNISYKNIEGERIADELEKFIEESHADLLALVYKKHTVLWRLFHQTPARSLIKYQKEPLLLLPENGKSNHTQPLKQKTNTVKRKRYHLL